MGFLHGVLQRPACRTYSRTLHRSRLGLVPKDSNSLNWRQFTTASIITQSRQALNQKYSTAQKPETTEVHADTSDILPSASARSTSTPASEYNGPLAPTFRRLKIFSLASFGLSAVLSPFMFIVESSLPTSARIGLAGIALTTSGVSTMLVGWCGKPYVTTLRHLRPSENDGIEGLEMTTLSLTLRKRITRVYDVDFLVETTRPFAKWELAQNVSFFPVKDSTESIKQAGESGQEEMIAETIADNGEVLGRWIVKWEENGVGRCRQVGNVIR